MKFTGQRSDTLKNCVSESFMPERSLISWSSMLALANGVHAFKLVLKPKADILNTNCSNRNRNRNLKISKALLKSQAHQGTSLFTSAATNQRGFPKGGQEKFRSEFQGTRN